MESELSILVNGEPTAVPGGCTVEGLLGRLGLGEQRLAVALNRHVVARGRFATQTIADGDHVEILEAIGGG